MSEAFILPGIGPAATYPATTIIWMPRANNYVASANDGVMADTSSGSWTLTLPSTPAAGAVVGVMDNRGSFQASPLTVSGNGAWIMGYGADLICNQALLSFSLGYSDTYMGWQIYPTVGASIGATKGYRAGGNSGYNATTDRTTFSTNATAAVTTANLTQGRIQACGITGSSAGYAIGGYTGAVVATADKLTYSTETTAAQASANLSLAMSALAGISNGYSKGYSLGGYTNNASPDGFVTADKVTFSNDTTAAQTSANLSQARAFVIGMNAGPSKGYSIGGLTNNGTVIVTTVDKTTYSSDVTEASTSAAFAVTTFGPGTCPGRLKGFVLGGSTVIPSVGVVTAVKITYSSDTSSSATTANLATGKYVPYGYADEAEGNGYILGGFTGSLVRVATAEKLTFSTETTASATTANLSTSIAHGASLTNQPAVTWP